MERLVNEYHALKLAENRRADLLMKRIRLKHPIFSLLTVSAFKYLMENCVLLKAKKG